MSVCGVVDKNPVAEEFDPDTLFPPPTCCCSCGGCREDVIHCHVEPVLQRAYGLDIVTSYDE